MSDFGESYHPDVPDFPDTETRALGRYVPLGEDAIFLTVRIEIRNPVFGAKTPLWFTLPDRVRVSSGTMYTVRTEKRLNPVEGISIPDLTARQLTTNRMVVYFSSEDNAELSAYKPINQAIVSANGILRIDVL